MQVLTATQVRKDIYSLIKAKKRVEIHHKDGDMVMIPKEELQQIEKEALAYEMDQVITNQEKYSAEEVNAMLAKVMDA